MQTQTAVNTVTKFPAMPPKPFAAGPKPTSLLPAVGSPHRVKAGQTLFAEGDDAHAVFEITQGILKLYKLLPDGRRQIMGFVTTGRLIGLTGNEAYPYTAEAVTDVTLSRYSNAQFDRLLDETGFARRVLNARSSELQSAQDQMLLLGRKTAVERIASFLLLLGKLQLAAGGATVLHVPMSRADIADYLGLTIETVSRTLTKLKRDQVISLPEAVEVKIIDRDRLEDLAAGETLEAA